MRFLVFSDLHLDHAFEGVGPDDAARRRADLRACLDRILALARTHEVDAILSAGDLYEHRHLQPGTASLLVDRLGQVGRPVFLAPGDDDPHTPDSLYATTTWPANVHVFDQDLLVPVDLADGFRLWGAAHLGRDDTPAFLDGFRIADDEVNLALFHGSEVGAASHDPAQVATPFRAVQLEDAGLTHAFVGQARPVDAPWHTSPGTPHPLGLGGPDPRGIVIVDVDPDGSVHRQRVDVAGPPVHEVTIDLAGAASPDEVLERVLASVEDLQGTVHVRLQGSPAPGVAVGDDEITSWSTERLEIVLAPRRRPRPADPTPSREVEPPPRDVQPKPTPPSPTVEPPLPRDVEPTPPTPAVEPPPRDVEPTPLAPSVEDVREVTAAHDAWQEALANLRRHEREEPGPAEPPDLGGLDLATVTSHLQTLQVRPSELEPDVPTEGADPQASPPPRESRLRGVGRRAALLLTVSSAIVLFLISDSETLRGVAVAAIVVVAWMTLNRQRAAAEDQQFAAARARASVVLRTMELSTELGQARHTASMELQQAGLPTDPDELAALVEAARMADAPQDAHAGWEQRRAALAAELVAATSRLRSALRRGGIAGTSDIEADLARFQARAARDPRVLSSPETSTSEASAIAG